MTMYNNGYRPSVVTFIPVNSENEARNYYVQPGGTTMFINTNAPELYSKTVDFSGQNVTFKTFDMIEREPPASTQPTPSFDENKLAAMISEIVDKKFAEFKQKPHKYNKPHNGGDTNA